MKNNRRSGLVKFLVVTPLLLMLLSFGFAITNPFETQEQTYKVELPISDWEIVLQVIESSTSPYGQVKAVKEVLINQLNQQITPQDTTQNGTNLN